jgi:hypothetical protein
MGLFSIRAMRLAFHSAPLLLHVLSSLLRSIHANVTVMSGKESLAARMKRGGDGGGKGCPVAQLVAH